MAERKSYDGGCHCGAVRYRAALALGDVISCNCSICRKKGHLLTFVPAADFELLSGAEHLKDYRFGKKVIHHLFCSTCGIGSFGRGTAPNGTEMVAINVRCLDGVDLEALTIMPYDGKSL